MYSGLSLGDITATDITPGVAGAAIKDYWPIERELLATIAEILHAIFLSYQKAHGVKNPGDVLQIPRPSHGASAPEDDAVGPGTFTRQIVSGGF